MHFLFDCLFFLHFTFTVATFSRVTLSILSDKRHFSTTDASSLTYRIKHACICVHPVRLFKSHLRPHYLFASQQNQDVICTYMPGGMNNPYNTILLSEVNITIHTLPSEDPISKSVYFQFFFRNH